MATITTKVNVTTATGPSAENPYNLGNGDTYTVTTESFKVVSGGAVNIASGAYAEGTDLTFANCKAYSEDKPASGGAVANFGTLTFKGNTVAFSGNTVVAGAYSANGGALYNTGVVTFECEAFFTGNKKDGVPSYGDAVYNIGTITFEKNVTFSNNGATSVHNYGTINFAKTMTLATEKDWFTNDTINMSGIDYIGTLNWDISEATTAADSAKLVGWNYLYIATGSKLAITVDAEDQLTGSYVIAEGATTETTASFTLKNNTDSTTATITVGGEAVEYNGRRYTLTQDTTAGTITLTAAAPVTYTLSFSPSSSATVSVGATSEVYTATVMGSDGIEYLIDDLSFDSEAPIATFNMKSNKTFTVTGESEGNNIPYTVRAWFNNGETVDATFDVTVEPLVSYTLTGTSGTAGGGVTFTVDGIEGATSARSGQTVELTPFEVAGYSWGSYTINGIVTTDSSFTMPAENVTVQVNYDAIEYSLASASSLGDQGGVNFFVNGSIVTAANIGQIVSLTAVEVVGYTFTSFTSTDVTIENNQFTMPPQSVTVTANYTALEYTLTGTSETVGGGVTFTVDGIETTTAHIDQMVDLTANAVAGYKWVSYMINGITTTDSSFTMPAENVTVQVNYDAIEYSLASASSLGDQGGVNFFVNGSIVTAANIGQIVSLTAVEVVGYTFTSFTSTDVTIENNQFTMPPQSVTVTANYQAIEYTLTDASTIGGVTFTVDGTVGATTAHIDQFVELTAAEVAGYKWVSYVINGITTTDTSFTMPAEDITVVANYEATSTYTLTLTPSSVNVSVGGTSDAVTAVVTDQDGNTYDIVNLQFDGDSPIAIFDTPTNNTFTVTGLEEGNANYTVIASIVDGIETTTVSTLFNVEVTAAPVGNDFTICICADGLLHKNSAKGEEITDKAITDHLQINADGIWEMTDLVFDTTAFRGIRLEDTNATITVNGVNSIIAGNGYDYTVVGIDFNDYNLALQGSGTLSVTTRDTTGNFSSALEAEEVGSLSIAGITLNAVSGNAGNSSAAIRVAGALLIQSGTVHAVAGAASNSAGIVVTGAQISDSVTVIAESASGGRGYMSYSAITTDGSTPATIYDAFGNELTWDGNQYTYVSGGTPASYITNVAAPVGNDFTICICADGLLHKNSVDGEEITDTAITDHLKINADGIWEMTDLVFDTTARYGIRLGDTNATITVDGTNSIIAGNGTENTHGFVFEDYSLALQGSGTLSVTARDTAANISIAFSSEKAGSLSINGITLNAVSGTAQDESVAIWAADALLIQSGTVHAVSGTAKDYQAGIVVAKAGAQISDSATVIAESTSGKGYMSLYAITTDGSTPATIYDADGNTLTWDGSKYTYVSGGTPASYVTNVAAPVGNDFTICICADGLLHKNSVDGAEITDTAITDHLKINADGIWEMTDLVFDTTARYGIQLGNTDVTITVDGTNSIIAGNGEDMTCGIMFENYSLALHGSGTLSVTARETTDKVSSAFGAAEDAGSLLIDGITLNAVSGNAGQISYGIWAVDGLTIQSGTVHAVSGTATYSTGIAVTKVGAQISDSATVIAESTSGYGYMSPYAITTDGSTPATIYDASGNTLTWDGDQYTYVSGGTPASYITNHGTAPEPVLYTLTLDPSSVNLTVDGSDVVTTTVTDVAGTQYTITDLQFSECTIANCVAAEDFNSFTVAALASGEESVTVTATLGNGKTVAATLALSVVPAPGAFYCSTWTENQPINVIWHGKMFSGTVGDGTFFNDYSGAKTKVASNNDFIVVMESSTITSVQHYDAQNVYLSCDDAVYNRMILGGELISGSHEYTGSYTVNIEGGTYMREVAGGDASDKYVDRTGNITLNISGGVFVGHVLGGSYYSAKSVLGSAVVVGDINFTISGGVFEQRVYGGCGSMTEEISSRAAMGGNVYLTIDASANAISFGECVAAGNRGNGLLLGSTNVTVTGLGSNLTFADSSVLFGGCGGDYYSTDSGVRTAVTNVVDPATWEDPGVRALTFSNFTGDFNAEIRMFSDITFDDSTLMNFADANLDLKEIETWNFDCTSFASNLNKNQFTGDTINVDTTALTEGSWTLLSGSESAFADLGSAASVTLGGATATYSGTAWTTDNFSLSVEDQTRLVISKIA